MLCGQGIALRAQIAIDYQGRILLTCGKDSHKVGYKHMDKAHLQGMWARIWYMLDGQLTDTKCPHMSSCCGSCCMLTMQCCLKLKTGMGLGRQAHCNAAEGQDVCNTDAVQSPIRVRHMRCPTRTCAAARALSHALLTQHVLPAP